MYRTQNINNSMVVCIYINISLHIVFILVMTAYSRQVAEYKHVYRPEDGGSVFL